MFVQDQKFTSNNLYSLIVYILYVHTLINKNIYTHSWLCHSSLFIAVRDE